MAKKQNEGAAGDQSDSSAAVPQATESAAALESLLKDNEGLQAQVQALTTEVESLKRELAETHGLTRELDAAVQASRQRTERRRDLHDGPLLRVMRRVSANAQKAGDGRTHQALEQVLVTLAEARHRVKEAAKVASGDGRELLEDLEEMLD